MAHRFDYSNSDWGVYTAFDYLFLSMEFDPMAISNSLLLGAGRTTGSVSWPDGAGTVSQHSHLSSNGAITTGILPDPVFSRTTQVFPLPPRIRRLDGFHRALLGRDIRMERDRNDLYDLCHRIRAAFRPSDAGP